MRVPEPIAPRQAQAAGQLLRVALVCRHPELRAGIHAALDGKHGIDMVAETGEYGQALPLIRASVPDVALMDFDGPGVSALETCRSLTRDAPLTRIVVMSGHCDDERLLRSALMAGVRGYVSGSAGTAELVSAIKAVAEGAAYVGQGAAWLMTGLFSAHLQSDEHDALSVLTRREREILELVARGYDNRRIARVLTLADKTVRNNISSVFRKIGVTRRAQAVVRAREAGFGLT
ncbi:response regulator transcription factor [Streptomyces europaeiscabiei]|uniref:response regulator transcription factor n=1 Tax=Streptomyces europaeiscabiei TaxID=146819 RepID=UPI002E2C4D2D|nr:response regulator transcription factor [Streptomyces europaeiscabiei]